MRSSTGLARSTYGEIALYAPDRAPCRIDLSDNTNAWGMPPAAVRALASCDSASVARYPRLYADELKSALSEYANVPGDMISTGCGSDDVLDSAIRVFSNPGDRLAYPDPTFPMIPIFGRMNGLVPVPVALTSTYDADVDGLLAANAQITYLCTPNNPTGNMLARAALEQIISQVRDDSIVIIDEAYAEFAKCSVLDLALASDRVLITRTMSKAFGLAGLRIGYGIGAPKLIAELEKSRGPYKVNAIAERAGVAALRDGMIWVREHTALSIEYRARLERDLADRGLSPVESTANFVFVPIMNAGAIAAAMRERGVAVRPFVDLPRMSPALQRSHGAALRFTIGTWPQLSEALDVFDEARAKCA